MNYIKINNWEKFQHYKDRCPPWIKLHANVLNNRHFMSLADDSKCLLMLLWILASEGDGRIKWNRDDICFRLRRQNLSNKDLQPLLENNFIEIIEENGQVISIAGASKCSSETETETETENIHTRKKFKKPTKGELREYADSINYIAFDPQAFLDHFESNGWKIGGKAPMKNWQAAVRNWRRRDTSQPKPTKAAGKRCPKCNRYLDSSGKCFCGYEKT